MGTNFAPQHSSITDSLVNGDDSEKVSFNSRAWPDKERRFGQLLQRVPRQWRYEWTAVVVVDGP